MEHKRRIVSFMACGVNRGGDGKLARNLPPRCRKKKACGLLRQDGSQQPLVSQHHPAEGADGERHDERNGESP